MKKNLQTRITCSIVIVLGAISNAVLSDATFLVLCLTLFVPLFIFPECYAE